MQKLTFLAGAAFGYVLGARAGRARYEELKRRADALWHDPRVQEKVSAAGQTVKEKAPEVREKIADAAGQAAATAKKATASAKDKVSGSDAETDINVDADVPTTAGDDLLIGSEPGSDYTPHETRFQSD